MLVGVIFKEIIMINVGKLVSKKYFPNFFGQNLLELLTSFYFALKFTHLPNVN